MFAILSIFLLTLLLITVSAVQIKTKDTSLATSGSGASQTNEILTWYKTSDMTNIPNGRRGHSSITSGDNLIIFGGCYLDQECYSDLYSYSTVTKIWSKINAGGFKPSAREGHSATLIGSKMYVFGGVGNSVYYSNLYIYDLATETWTEGKFDGPSPSGRANHGSGVDTDGRLVIFGGYTENGYSSDVYILDVNKQVWAKPYIAGNTPIPRESFSMTRFHNTFWIFGGFTDGGVLSDLVVLDMDSLKWTSLETQGNIPAGRQGHQMILMEKNMIMMGGCDYKKNLCYSDTYYLATDTLFWTKLSEERVSNINPIQQFSGNAMGGILYLFGGCKLYETCFNDVLYFDTNVLCPNGCSDKGVCRNKKCTCNSGFYDNDCSLQVKCADNCNDHGTCQTTQICNCYPGYTGSLCEIYVPCPQNCTNEYRGVCQNDASCACKPGITGEACETGEPINPKSCPNSCSGQGTCDIFTGKCKCNDGFIHEDCSEQDPNYVAPPVAAEDTQQDEQLEPEPTIAGAESQPVQVSRPADAARAEQANEAAQTQNQIAQAFEDQQVPDELTPEMFGESYTVEQTLGANEGESSIFGHLAECRNQCNFNGICQNKVCFCQQGFYGEDCSVTDPEYFKIGEPLQRVFKYGAVCFGIGIIAGIILIVQILQKGDIKEYNNIQKKEDDD